MQPPHRDPMCAALLWYLCGPLQGTAGGPGGQRYRATLCPTLVCGGGLWLPELRLLVLPAPFVAPLSDGAPLSVADPLRANGFPSACAKNCLGRDTPRVPEQEDHPKGSWTCVNFST